MFCFFFKQKTAYEMRISDWSSDVCSSDLADRQGEHDAAYGKAYCREKRLRAAVDRGECASCGLDTGSTGRGRRATRKTDPGAHGSQYRARHSLGGIDGGNTGSPASGHAQRSCDYRSSRSEENTYELQSIMRISYAV